jgi:hypothetical protein
MKQSIRRVIPPKSGSQNRRYSKALHPQNQSPGHSTKERFAEPPLQREMQR